MNTRILNMFKKPISKRITSALLLLAVMPVFAIFNTASNSSATQKNIENNQAIQESASENAQESASDTVISDNSVVAPVRPSSAPDQGTTVLSENTTAYTQNQNTATVAGGTSTPSTAPSPFPTPVTTPLPTPPPSPTPEPSNVTSSILAVHVYLLYNQGQSRTPLYNAKVVVKNSDTGAHMATGYTNPDGYVSIPEIPHNTNINVYYYPTSGCGDLESFNTQTRRVFDIELFVRPPDANPCYHE